MKRGAKWLGGALAALVLGGLVYLLATGAPLGRIVEAVSEGSQKPLNEPMRAPRGGPRVLVFALDGVGADELLAAVRGGRADNIAALFGAEGAASMRNAYAVPGVLSVLPSTTLAAWTSLFTGEPPSRTGVPGNEWFAREEARFYAPAPVTIEETDHALAVYTDDLLGSAIRVPTVFDRANVRAYVALAQVHRGADLLIMPDLSIVGDLAAALVAGVADGEAEAVEQEAYSELDHAAADRLLEALREHGLPDLQVVYFPGVDLYTHVAQDALESQRRYLSEVIDSAVARVVDAYRAAGALQETYILFVSDHGHTPVLNDDRHALSMEGVDEPPEVLRRIGFRVRPPHLELDEAALDFQATVAYQGAMAYVYLADRSTCEQPGQPCTWAAPPRFEDDVLSVVRAFDEANRTGAHVPAMQGTLDLIFARRARPVTEDALPFEVWDGTALVPVADYLARNPRPDLLDFESRLRGLAAGPYGHRAGDVLLLARSGVHLPVEERFYFSAEYRSWHGSPTAQDSNIPLILSRQGVSEDSLRARVHAMIGDQPSQLDVTRLILALLREPL